MRKKLAALGFITAALFASAANATKLVNMDSVAHDISFQTLSDTKTVHIDAGEAYETEAHPLFVVNGTKRMELEDGVEYTLWKDGSITPQVRVNNTITHKR